MNVKLDTKEKFQVITPMEAEIPEIMTDEWVEMLESVLKKDTPHLIVNMENVMSIGQLPAAKLASIQQNFYEKNCSMIICCLSEKVEEQLEKSQLLETMNVTPTESEAWDIMHMEEIERELMDDEN